MFNESENDSYIKKKHTHSILTPKNTIYHLRIIFKVKTIIK